MTRLPVEDDLRAALSVDPSPSFAAGVRARIAQEPAAAERRFGWMWMPAVAGALAAIVLAIALWPSPVPAAGPRPLLTARSTVSTTTLPAVTPSSIRQTAPPARPVRPWSPASHDPEILISPSESRAIRNLIAGIRSGRIDPATLPPETPVVDLEIKPIVIAPLAVLDGAEGVRQ